MTDDRMSLEIRLHDAFRREGLPAAPPSLFEALDGIAEMAANRKVVVARTPRSGRLPWGAIGIAAVLAVGSGLALLSVGSPRPVVPAPSTPPSAPTAPLRITYEPAWTAEVPKGDAALARIAAILRQRLDAIGVAGGTARVEGGSIVVEAPAPADADAVRRFLGQSGRFALAPLGDATASPGALLDEATHAALLDSAHVRDAQAATDQVGAPTLRIQFNAPGTTLLADYTRTHVGSSFAIALDGVVVLAGTIMSEIPGGDLEVSFGGNDARSDEEVRRLAALIRIGPLPVPILEVAAGVGPQEPAQSPRLASPSSAPSAVDPSAPLPSAIAEITTCDNLPPISETYLTCEAAVASALLVIPAGSPPPVSIDFVHTCRDVIAVPAAADCYVHAMGVVTIGFAGGMTTRIGVGLGQAPMILPASDVPTAT